MFDSRRYLQVFTPFWAAMLWSATGTALAEEHAIHRFDVVPLTDVYFSEGANVGDIDGDGVVDAVYGPYWFKGPDFQKRFKIYPPKAQPREALRRPLLLLALRLQRRRPERHSDRRLPRHAGLRLRESGPGGLRPAVEEAPGDRLGQQRVAAVTRPGGRRATGVDLHARWLLRLRDRSTGASRSKLGRSTTFPNATPRAPSAMGWAWVTSTATAAETSSRRTAGSSSPRR